MLLLGGAPLPLIKADEVSVGAALDVALLAERTDAFSGAAGAF